jgi:hypothetical protein
MTKPQVVALCRASQAVRPPSTVRVLPVTNRDAPDAGNTARPAGSSASPALGHLMGRHARPSGHGNARKGRCTEAGRPS